MRATVKKVIKTEIKKQKTEGEKQETRTWIQFTVMMNEEDYQDGNQEAEDRRQGTRNKNLNSVYCHDEQKSKNKDRGENENLSRTRADKVLNKSQRSVH